MIKTKINKITKSLANSKRKRILSIVLSVAAISILLIWQIQPFVKAAVTVSSVNNGSATAHSTQRKTWYDGSRYWVGIFDESRIEFWYSSDGSSWTENTNARIDSNNTIPFSVEADSSNLFIAYQILDGGQANDIEARKATSYPGTGFSWGAATVVLNGDIGPSHEFNYDIPSIERDTNNKINIVAVEYDLEVLPATTTISIVSRQSISANDISSFGSVVYAHSDTPPNVTMDSPTVVPLANGDLYTVFANGAYREGSKWNGSSWDSNRSRFGTAEGVSPSSTQQLISDTSADEAYMSYVENAGKIKFKRYIDDAGTSGTKIDDAGNPGAMIDDGRQIVRTSSGTLYAAFKDDTSLEIWSSTNGSTWTQQDTSDSPVISSTSHVSMAIDSSNAIHLVYKTGTTTSKYRTFTTSDNQFGGEENLASSNVCDIVVDSNNVPHTACQHTTNANYTYQNRVGGSWNSSVTITSMLGGFESINITINEDNVPELAIAENSTNDLIASLGNANNATSFSNQVVQDNSIGGTAGTYNSSIGIDSDGNTWIAFIDEDGVSDYISLIKHNDGDAWSTWQSPVSSTVVGKEPSIYINGKDIHVLYVDSADDIAVKLYNPEFSWTDAQVLATGTYSDVKVRWANNHLNNNEPLDFTYSDGTDVFYGTYRLWLADVILDSNSGNSSTTISKMSGTEIYAFWIRSNTIYYKKGVYPYTSSDWDSNATALYSTGTNNFLTAAHESGNGAIPLAWTNGSNPWSVLYQNFSGQTPPGAPTLSQPTASATGVSFTPQFQFAATDGQGEYIRYGIKVYSAQTECNSDSGTNLVRHIDQTSSQTGWSGQDTESSTAYTSGTTATHTYQPTALSAGTTYWWKARGIDPGGSNTWGSWTTCQSFTTNSIPTAPTLVEPSNGQVGVITGPNFRLRTTDTDNDYLKYWIDICSTSNCSAIVRSICQTNSGTGAPGTCSSPSQTGWSSQSTQSNTAYTSGQTALHTYQPTALNTNTQYWWRAYAVDPGGSNTWSSASGIGTFTTSNPSTSSDKLFQGQICFGAC